MGRTIDFEKIQLTDDIMFSSVLGNPEHCQEFLERILGFKIKELHIMESQKSMKPGLYSKGIRLDIYAKDEQGNAAPRHRGIGFTEPLLPQRDGSSPDSGGAEI